MSERSSRTAAVLAVALCLAVALGGWNPKLPAKPAPVPGGPPEGIESVEALLQAAAAMAAAIANETRSGRSVDRTWGTSEGQCCNRPAIA